MLIEKKKEKKSLLKVVGTSFVHSIESMLQRNKARTYTKKTKQLTYRVEKNLEEAEIVESGFCIVLSFGLIPTPRT